MNKYHGINLEKFEKAKVADEILRDYLSLKNSPHYHQCLTRHALKTPEKSAIIFYGREITYKELDELSNSFSAAIIDMGLKKGDRIGLFMQNCPQFWICFFGIQKIGAISVFLNPMNKDKELEYYAKSIQMETIVAEYDLYPIVEKIRDSVPIRNIFLTAATDFLAEQPTITLFPGMDKLNKAYSGTYDLKKILQKYPKYGQEIKINVKEDPLFIVFTSGTTGLPKGIIHTHYNVLYHACVKRVALRYQLENGVTMVMLPLFHLASFQTWNPTFYRGGTIVLLYRWHAISAVEAMSKYRVTVMQLPVGQYEEMMTLPNIEKYDLSSCEVPLSVSFGRVLTNEPSEKWERLTGHKLIEGGYGMSETLSHDVSNIFEGKIPPVVGRPTPGTEMKILDIQTGKELPDGQKGKVLIRTPCLFKEYWSDPDQTKEAISEEGWFDTGDVGKIDEQGYFHFLGRIKEMIKVSGWSVFPDEVESLIKEHPAVDQVAVIGISDKKKGEIPKAFIVLKKEFKGKVTDQSLINWCKENMSSYKYPRRIEFRDSLPTQPSGKIRRIELKKEEEEKKNTTSAYNASRSLERI